MEELMGGSAEMLGRGQVGTTYRVVMQGKGDENGVVVKRVRRERREEEERRERRVLMEIGGFRHSNVVPLRGFYSSPDELLLVFDFVTNGSLYHLLHGNALISDFSLLRLIPNSLCTKEVFETQKADVYSFGVVLLEILTGRMAEDCQAGLVNWVQTFVKEECTSELYDMELWGFKEIEDEMMALLQVALLCVANEVKNRPKMETVYKMIEEIRDRGSRSRSRSSNSRSPSLLFESSPSLSEDTPTLSH
ncbi:hypothetical protein LUZ60_000374 [Juncus effusus]|nr:hypothetical protein LUZ60_000374 [Juncus effusus]